jgi:hypothetical protein
MIKKMPGHNQAIATIVAFPGYNDNFLTDKIRKLPDYGQENLPAGIFHKNRPGNANFLNGQPINLLHLA